MSNDYKALIQYRIEQANESLDSAEILFKNEKYRPSVKDQSSRFLSRFAKFTPATRFQICGKN